MPNMAKLLLLVAAMAMLLVGCSENRSPVDASDPNPRLSSAITAFELPEGAVLDSATFYIHVNAANNQQIDIHRITADWMETTVTWNSFGGSFDNAVEGSFLADGTGWRSVDITSLAGSWLDGTNENFGILLDQVEETYPRALYSSREDDTTRPWLQLCYTVDGSTECEELIAVADAYIWEVGPDDNFGTSVNLYTGWKDSTDLEKQSLVRFEREQAPETAAIGDLVWYDDDMDGIQDEGEIGVAGIPVSLFDCEDNFVAMTTTDSDGR
ncbi:DNRLRE domain-containing protein, partial [candidate division GN15 bacterium]|nr:DNRLRE domain-containing protein [candidate division GN15 bacterium]